MCGECTMFDVIVALESCVRCGVWSRGSIGDIVTVRALFRCVLSQTTCALGCRGCVNISQTRMTKSNQSDTRETYQPQRLTQTSLWCQSEGEYCVEIPTGSVRSKKKCCVNHHTTLRELFHSPRTPISVRCNFCCWNFHRLLNGQRFVHACTMLQCEMET